MKLKLVEIGSMIGVLPAVIDAEGLPTKTGYWLGRAYVDLMREHEPYEQTRMKAITKHAKKDENGEMVTEQRGDDRVYIFDDPAAYEAEMADIANEEIQIKYEPISIDDFGDAVIKGSVLLKLGRLIKEPDEVKPLSVVE